jgi:hypothetical protein
VGASRPSAHRVHQRFHRRQILQRRREFHAAGGVEAAGLNHAEHTSDTIGTDATGQPPRQRRFEANQPFQGNAMALSPQLIGHPGIEQEGIDHRAVGVGPGQILGSSNPQCLPELQPGPSLADLVAALRRLVPVELQGRGAASAQVQIWEVAIAGVRQHQHPPAGRGHRGDGSEQGRLILQRNPPGRGFHADHSDRVNSKPGDGLSLPGLTQATDLEKRRHGRSGSVDTRPTDTRFTAF